MGGLLIPETVGGLVGWFDSSATDTLTESGGAVSQWNDLSPRQADTTQGTGAEQPTTNSQTLAGKNVVAFDEDGLLKSSYSFATPGTMLVLHQWSTLDSERAVINVRADTNNTVELFTGTTVDELITRYKGSATDSEITFSPKEVDTKYLVTFDYDEGADAINFWINGTSVGSAGTLGAFTGTPDLAIGYNGTTIATGFDGLIGEWLLYDHVLSTAERDKLETYLAQKWGVSI